MEATVAAPDLDRPVRYRWAGNGLENDARLRVWFGRRVAMLSNQGDGPSITNAAEDAWGVVADVLDIAVGHPAGWTLVEHYPADPQRSDTLDVVSFDGRDPRGRLTGTRWAPALLVDGLAWLRAYVVFHDRAAV